MTDDASSDRPLRSGWTTGACATAAALAAFRHWRSGGGDAGVTITLPGGQRVDFAVARSAEVPNGGQAVVVKDAGDDPDVTHGAEIVATVIAAEPGSGILFRAGVGVGTVTKAGLPLPVGEPAINPVPRQMISDALTAANGGVCPDLIVEISVPKGEALAQRTWNPRLGILGGISILGTTGIVVPYSCSAWIHSIQRGIDVARAAGCGHVAGCVGNTSEKAVTALFGLAEEQIIDMGDFVGGMLKYLRQHPVPRVTLAGGFAKLSKLAAGHLDLHSKRSQVDLRWLADRLAALGAAPELVQAAAAANTALEVLTLATAAALPLGQDIAQLATEQARKALGADVTGCRLETVVFDRKGGLVGHYQENLR